MAFDRMDARVDPADSGIAPDRAMVGRALRVAEAELTRTRRADVDRRDYWSASVAALRWALGDTATSPLRVRPGRVALEASRTAVVDEAEYAYACMTGGPRLPEHVSTLGYLSGLEHTLHWVAHGTGFAASLTDEALQLDGILQ